MSTLKKELTVTGLTMVAIGSCIGSGIFITPAEIVKNLPHHGYALLVWLIGGIIAYLGALTFSELSSRYPDAGGVYVYLREGYGELAGFLYGWIILLIVNTGALAALSIGLVDFLSFFFEIGPNLKLIIAATIILSLTLINIIGVNISQSFAKIFTGLKLLAIGMIIAISLYYWQSKGQTINVNLFENKPEKLMTAMLLALVGVFWSFGGWHHATYLSGETKNAQTTVPKAMLYGTSVVTITYILAVLAFMILLPLEEMAASLRVAGDALGAVMLSGGKIVSVIISISIFGTIGIYTMTAPRIYFAMAKDGVFFKKLSEIHPKFRTPHYAMLFQAVWAIALLLIWGTFYRLIVFVTFMDIVFMALATATIFVFRKRQKDIQPVFKLKSYPTVPIIYLLITIAFVINTMFHLGKESFAGIFILALGIPVFYLFKKYREQRKA